MRNPELIILSYDVAQVVITSYTSKFRLLISLSKVPNRAQKYEKS